MKTLLHTLMYIKSCKIRVDGPKLMIIHWASDRDEKASKMIFFFFEKEVEASGLYTIVMHTTIFIKMMQGNESSHWQVEYKA